MTLIRLESVAAPLDAPSTGPVAARVLARVEAMGLLPDETPIRRLDRALLDRVIRRVSSATGIGRDVLVELRHAAKEPAALGRVLQRFYEELEHSPSPQTEWGALVKAVGSDLLASLLAISPTSLRRYASGARTTPDEVADRLHYLALVVADLAGSYNEFGVRRWFARARPQLGMRLPAQLLRGHWRSESEGARGVRELARALTGPLAT